MFLIPLIPLTPQMRLGILLPNSDEESATTKTKGHLPSDHTDNQEGKFHGLNKNDPNKYCTGCHGQDLQGAYAESCFPCHNANDHTASKKHKTGKPNTCIACHGPNNSGWVLGPACANCHK